MALIDLGRTSGHASSLVDQFRAAAHYAVTAITEWNDARRTHKALSQLSDYELDDIGLSRADINTMFRRGDF